jgi:hypothetical protein
MNKQLTKKTIGIAASAALIASLAVSGSAFAGPGNNNGPKGSIGLYSICYIETEAEIGVDVPAPYLRVETTITDESSVLGDATLDGMVVQAREKYKGPWSNPDNFQDIGDPDVSYPELAGAPPAAHVTSRIPLCQSAMGNPTLTKDARSVNALITIQITDEHNNKEMGFTARCSDDPDTYYVDEVAELNVWKQNLCQ